MMEFTLSHTVTIPSPNFSHISIMSTVDEIFKPLKPKGKTRDVKCYYPKHIYSADLVVFDKYGRQNQGYKYVLTCIDCYSRYAFTYPLKTKGGREIVKAFQSIFEEGTPEHLWTDRGKEFTNKIVRALLKRERVNLYHTNSDIKASITERFNRTLRNKMFRDMTERSTREWLSTLPTITATYNDTPHTFLKGDTPTQVFEGKSSYPIEAKVSLKPPKFKEGDIVRMRYKRGTFDRGYYPNWSWQTYRITDVHDTNPHTYSIEDGEEKKVKGKFYDWELLKSEGKFGVFHIDEIVERRTKDGIREVKVKWIGYDETSWIPEADVEDL